VEVMPLVNRLAEVKNATAGEEDVEAQSESESGKEGGQFMDNFFEQVKVVKEDMRAMGKKLAKIEDAYARALNEVKIEKAQQAAEEAEQLTGEITKLQTKTKEQLEAMKNDTEEYKNSNDATNTEVRLRTNMHGTLTTKFVELLQHYNDIQTDYDNKYRERLKREYKIVKPDMPDEEIEAAIQTGESSAFQGEMADRQAAEDALAYIQNRHNDLIRLQASIKELHGLFVDMALLVAKQGELIDQIEYNVSTAVSHVDKANAALKTANVYAKKSRKKIYIILGAVLILIAVVLLPTLITQFGGHHSSTG